MTPTPRELYVKRLLSQNRNSANSITGPPAVTVGDEVTYVLDAKTALGGFEQLEAFLRFPSSMFQVLRVTATYAKPAGATNDTMYADACGWDAVPTSLTYLDCIGPARYDGGKVGGALLSTFTVKVMGTGATDLTAAIYDKSGLSYHYNADFSVRPNTLTVTATAPAPTTIVPAAPTTAITPATAVVPAVAPRDDPSTGDRVAAAMPSSESGSADVAATGRSDTGALSLVGLLLLSVGVLALAASRVGERPSAPTSFERSLHDLRRTLHQHEDAGAEGWLLMGALDRVARALQDK